MKSFFGIERIFFLLMKTSKVLIYSKPITLILFSILCSATSGGKEVLLRSTNEAIRMAFLHNRDLRVTEPSVEQAKRRLLLSGRLSNPKLEVSSKGDAFGNNQNEGNFEVAIRQSFPISSRLRRERELRKRQVNSAEAELAKHGWRLAAEVDETVIGLIAAKERTEGQRSIIKINAEIVNFIQKQVVIGEASPLDLSQAKLTGRTLEQAETELTSNEKQESIKLKQLLGIEPDDDLSLEKKLELPAEEPKRQMSLEEILERRADYALAMARADATYAALNLEKSKRIPDVEVSVFLERERSFFPTDGLSHNTIAGLGVSIPIPFRQKNADTMEQARFDRIKAERKSQALRFRVRNEYAQALRATRDAWRLAKEASGEILQLAEKNLADFQSAYRKGQTSLLRVQRAQEQLLAQKNAALEAIVNFHLTKARLREVMGDYPTPQFIPNEVLPTR